MLLSYVIRLCCFFSTPESVCWHQFKEGEGSFWGRGICSSEKERRGAWTNDSYLRPGSTSPIQMMHLREVTVCVRVCVCVCVCTERIYYLESEHSSLPHFTQNTWNLACHRRNNLPFQQEQLELLGMEAAAVPALTWLWNTSKRKQPCLEFHLTLLPSAA